jgi:uncharacterized membrane protein YhaH (DUF805 family)
MDKRILTDGKRASILADGQQAGVLVFLLINLLILALPLATWFLAMQHNLSTAFSFFAHQRPLPMIVPLLAVGCRRMHDIGRSGWWFALCLIIPWFLIVALWLCCLKPAASSR